MDMEEKVMEAHMVKKMAGMDIMIFLLYYAEEEEV